MSDKKQKKSKLYLNIRIKIFLQFVLIFSIITLSILITSSSFYITITETRNMFHMRNAAEQLADVDFSSADAIREITKIEYREDVVIEIYSESDPQNNIYAKCYHSVINTSDNTSDYNRDFNPIINFNECDVEIIQEYDNNSYSGTTKNDNYEESFFVLVTPDEDRDYVYITAVEYSVIENQARSVATSSFIITIVIFIAVSIVFFFYITRITRPLDDIIRFTRIMSEGSDKSIRIPSDKDILTPQTGDAITNINALYASLMLTQERLMEKSVFLSEQLAEKDEEQKSRSKLVANISHELKTPISIIQGYAEGIKYVLDDKQTTNEYCDTILEECARMTDLVVDMMSLSDIQRSTILIHTIFNIREFLEERIRLHGNFFEKESIEVRNLIDKDIYGYADTSKLQFVVNNLISNAVSYIGGEDKLITIRYEDTGNSYRIIVYNTGSPIPTEHLDKLWDSFYRQDTARIRSEGHFGLGLSIVKAVQDAHSQQCGVSNTDGGVEFWFDIAKGRNKNQDK